MRYPIAILVAALASFGLASPAAALVCGTILDPLTVTATAMDFGQYDASQAGAATTNGTVIIKCAVDLAPSFTVALSAGAGGGFSPRAMTQGAQHLNYNLYTAGDYALVWGDTNSGTTAVQSYSGLLLLGTVPFTVYGRIPPGQFVKAGDYTDVITVTVTF